MYNKLPIGKKQPGLILILIDQSGSMNEPFGSTTKKEFAALAVNRCLYEIISACTQGTEIRPRCQLGVYGYNGADGVKVEVGGWLQEVYQAKRGIKNIIRKQADGAGGLIDVPFDFPYWIEATAKGTTPMADAFNTAAALIRDNWLPNYGTTSFPPIVINITDGAPTDAAGNLDFAGAETAARNLLSLQAADGAVLLLNAHISDANQAEIKLPASLNSLPSSLKSEEREFAQFLFRISSELPPPLLDAARIAGFNPETGSRGFIFNANAESLTKLIAFGSMTSQMSGL